MSALRFSIKMIGTVAVGLIFLAVSIVQGDSQSAISTSQVYQEGKWVTEWPNERVEIELTRVEDRRFHGGQLSPEPDGTYVLKANGYVDCYYNIALSPDHKKMFWVPAKGPKKEIVPPPAPLVTLVNSCRPATIFSRIQDCCEERRDRDCCKEEHRDRDCCKEEHRDRDCCKEERRDRDCCKEEHRDRDCCKEKRRDRDCCKEERRDRNCCGEGRRREIHHPRPISRGWRPRSEFWQEPFEWSESEW